MSKPYTFVPDLAAAAAPPADGILSRAIYQDDSLKAILFGFDAGQELSEHTASVPALVQIVSGEGELTLGDDIVALRPGSWVHMPAGLRHAIRAKTPLVMLLLMLKGGGARTGAQAGTPAGQR